MAYLVVSCTLEKLEKRLMTRSLVPLFWGEGRRVTGVDLNPGEAEEGVDGEVPGAFMWMEGKTGYWRKVLKQVFQIITSNLIISDEFFARCWLHI